MKTNINTKKAFTLIEVLLYMSLTSVLVLMIAMLWVTASDTRDRGEAMSIVSSEATSIISKLTQTIRNASAVNTPTIGNSGSTLSLVMASAANSPTGIALSGGNITITEGSNPANTLNSNRVTISSLTFRNVTENFAVGSVRIEITVTYINTTGKPALDYSQTFYATATLR